MIGTFHADDAMIHPEEGAPVPLCPRSCAVPLSEGDVVTFELAQDGGRDCAARCGIIRLGARSQLRDWLR